MKKQVFDTSLLIHAPNFIEIFKDNSLRIPFPVLEELDQMKTDSNGVGFAARKAIEAIDFYQRQGSLIEGVRTVHGGMLHVDYQGELDALPTKLKDIPDNRIIAIAYDLQLREHEKPESEREEVILITKDRNMRIKANALGLKAEDFESGKVVSSLDELYTGREEIVFPPDSRLLIQEMYKNHSFPETLVWDNAERRELLPNACCWLLFPVAGSAEPKLIPAIYKKAAGIFRRVEWKKSDVGKKRGINPWNAEQAFIYDLATDPDIDCVAIIGEAGTGKTIMELAAGMYQLEVEHSIERIIAFRPNTEVGNKLGHLPGGVDKKFVEPYGRVITDNLRLCMEAEGKQKDGRSDGYAAISNRIKGMLDAGRLEISPINFTRGITVNFSFVIIDEAQNFTPGNMKLLVTRAGTGTKMLINGDITQIDEHRLDPLSNGLASTVHDLHGEEHFATLHVYEVVRSRLAALAARKMR